MALVCDIKSNTSKEDETLKSEVDLEDGEIEDDEDETPVEQQEPPKPEAVVQTPVKNEKSNSNDKFEREKPRDRPDRSERRRHEEKGKKHMTEAEKSILHLRKREEMQRKKWEKFTRNKDTLADPLDMSKVVDDDFAKNIEKTLATILNKKEKEAAAVSGEEEKEKEEEKRGKKRRKADKDRLKNKQRKIESPKSEIDENEMLNIRGGSPERRQEEKRERSATPQTDESVESEYSSDRSRSDERGRRRDGKKMSKRNRDREHGRDRNKNRDRDRRNEQQPLKDSQGVCVFYLQGKCQKNDCPYSHEAVPPMKLELCKFYLMDCCAKGDKCSYMHSEFPCKFYHTGLNCLQGDNCKFAHGKSLSEGLKQILFKHIETAPRDILGGFPRMSREEALNLINITQNKLQEQHGGEVREEPKGGIPSLFDINVPVPPELLQGGDDGKSHGKNEKTARNRPSRWQDPDPMPSKDMGFPLKPFSYGQDQDMRIRNSNGDIDMRTLPPAITTLPQTSLPLSKVTATESNPHELDIEKYKREAGILNSPPKQDLDIRSTNLLPYAVSKDVDIRHQPLLATKDVDIRQLPPVFDDKSVNKAVDNDTEDEPMLQIDTGEDKPETPNIPVDLPKTQRELFLRIQAQQKETVMENESKEGFDFDDNINWYSDDDDEDDNRLTIKVDNEEVKEKEDAAEGMDATEHIMSPPQIKPLEVVERLGDLSKIDISAEVTKLLTSMSQSRNQFSFAKESTEVTPPSASAAAPVSDPRLARQDQRPAVSDKLEIPRTDPRLTVVDPRQRTRQSSTETQPKPEKISIYEQGSIDRNLDGPDSDFRGSMRSDVDLRNLQLPFKGMQNYTPATEIDASINSHLPMPWKVQSVEIPRPDYTGLKLSISDAEKTGDPRLRKIFRLSIEERDTPLSPKASPKANMTARVDPRLRKLEDNKPEATSSGPMNFNQQLSMLQNSAFYQSLTSNQKVLLNQELSQRGDSSNSHDPVLNTLLSNLNIIPGASIQPGPTLGTALSILTNVSKLSPILPQGQQGGLPVNPTILGQNPNIMNQMAQSIAQPGLLGAAPGIPNLPPDFPINFDPRNGGLLGNAPMPFGGFPPQDGPGNFNNFNEEFYPPDGSSNFHNNQGNRDNSRGFNRERRRGRNFNRNNPGNRNFRNNRNNRANRTHSPP